MGDLEEGGIKIDRRSSGPSFPVKADGRTLEANVPHMSALPAPQGRRKQERSRRPQGRREQSTDAGGQLRVVILR
jgi:hypothetical protein